MNFAAAVLASIIILLLVAVYVLFKGATVTRRANAPEDGESARRLRPQADSYLWVRVRYRGKFIHLALTDNELMRSMTRGASNDADRGYEVPLDAS